ncbi:tetratricopeptide repeat protein [Reinekea sp.]|jgi:hypothetical protein|uniref:tetratricopeptide repeat protein n=1 Tax=Reinekea sp. TaxID=1970455 RepID=UPI003988A9B5
MSAIHQALQRATNTPAEPLNRNDYNPLASNLGGPKKKSKGSIFYWFLAGAFLVLIPVVVFWPMPGQTPIIESQQTLNTIPEPAVQESSRKAQGIETTPVQAESLIAPKSATLESESTSSPIDNGTAVVESVATRSSTFSPARTNPVSSPPSPEATVDTQPIIKSKPAAQQSKVADIAKVAEEPKAESTLDVVTVSAKHWQSKVEQHLADGNIEHAEAVLKQWIGGAPQDEAPRLWLARIYLSNQLYSSAESLLTQLESNEALALKGILFEKTKRFGLASAQFSELFEREPESGRWLLMWAVNTENSGKLARSLDLYQAFIRNFNYEDEALTTFAQQRVRALGGS